MDMRPEPFEPPAPIPRTVPPSRLEIIRTMLRNPLELWGEPSYTLPWIDTKFFNQRTLIVNDPGLIRHVLVDNASNYRMSDDPPADSAADPARRPADGGRRGLEAIAQGRWRRSSRRATPRVLPARCCARPKTMPRNTTDAGSDGHGFQHRHRHDRADLRDPRRDAVFRRDRHRQRPISPTTSTSFCIAWAASIRWTFCGRPSWVPRADPHRRAEGAGQVSRHRPQDDGHAAGHRCAGDRASAPDDFLTLLLEQAGPDGLTTEEIEDNILTFIGAGHETTARALAWTLYCVANTPHVREADGSGNRSGAGERRRAGGLARPDAACPRRLRGGDAALSAGALDQPRGDRGRCTGQRQTASVSRSRLGSPS